MRIQLAPLAAQWLIVSCVAASVLSAQAPPSAAQSTKPAFQSASVKPDASGNRIVQFIPDAPGWFTAINAPLSLLLRFAYDQPDFAVIGAPNWTSNERFDITARVPDNASIDARRLMLQGLFEERFMLVSHSESRPLPIYTMRLSNRNGALGPHLHRSNADCSDEPMLPLMPGRVRPPENIACGFFGMAPASNLPAGQGGMAFRGLTMAALAKAWTTMVHRTVVDRTGLTGYFDGEFDFVSEMPPPPPPPGLANPFTAPFASIFSVVPDQLGLKLDSDRGPVDVVVIDSIQHPTSD